MGRAAERSMGDFNVQDLSNTGWAFATVGQSDESLFMALARAAEQCLDVFNVQNLCTAFWVLLRRQILTEAWRFFEHTKWLIVQPTPWKTPHGKEWPPQK